MCDAANDKATCLVMLDRGLMRGHAGPFSGQLTLRGAKPHIQMYNSSQAIDVCLALS